MEDELTCGVLGCKSDASEVIDLLGSVGAVMAGGVFASAWASSSPRRFVDSARFMGIGGEQRKGLLISEQEASGWTVVLFLDSDSVLGIMLCGSLKAMVRQR